MYIYIYKFTHLHACVYIYLCIYMCWYICIYMHIYITYIECDVTQMNWTWLIRIWHDPYECDMTQMIVTWRIWMWSDSWLLVLHAWSLKIRITAFPISTFWQMSHDAYACDMTYHEWVMTHENVIRRLINESWHTWMWNASWMSHHKHKCDMVHVNETWCMCIWYFAYEYTWNVAKETFELGALSFEQYRTI